MAKDSSKLEAYIRDGRRRYEDWLAAMVELPSVSMDPARAGDVRKTAELAVRFITALGGEATLVETGGHPVVSGGWMTGRRHPTVTIYNHLDVQPAQEPEWRHPPFAFRREDGVYHGRGTTDDKGPALAALLAARYAVAEGLPINVRVLWESEEEIGSPHFAAALAQRALVPKPDSVLVSDTIWLARDRPAMPCGLRGLLTARLSLRTGTTDAHSGVTGGAARNPLTELCALAAACVDARSGLVKIPGFYEGAARPTAAEIRGFLKSGFDVGRFMRAYGLTHLRTKDPAEVVRRIWTEPTFEVHGLAGGYHGPGVKTIVPAWGELKVSMRLVPGQKPRAIFARFRRFIRDRNPHVRVECESVLEPFHGEATGPYAAAGRRALTAAFGREPAFVREGGSIGAVVTMAKAWRVPIVFMGLSLPEHGYHAPNERFDWGQASGGMRAFAAYFAELARMK